MTLLNPMLELAHPLFPQPVSKLSLPFTHAKPHWFSIERSIVGEVTSRILSCPSVSVRTPVEEETVKKGDEERAVGLVKKVSCVEVPLPVIVPPPEGVAHTPSPRQNVVASASVPAFKRETGRFPITSPEPRSNAPPITLPLVSVRSG